MDMPERAHPRIAAVQAIQEAIMESMEVMPSGPQEGLRFVTENSLVDAFMHTPLPPLREYVAEVATNGTVYVTAKCPRCNESAPIRLEIGVVLTQDDDGATLKLKGRSKAVTHLCGQMYLDKRVDEHGDTSFTLADIIGAATDPATEDEPEEPDA